MVRVAPINLCYNPKTLWFDAGDLDVREGDGVIVSTVRGTEFGRAAREVFEIDEDQAKKLKAPLKPVKRVASPADERRAAELDELAREALPVFKQMAAEAIDEMHPVSVEYLFEGNKAVFYFEAEERVDFRELVRQLASRFHVRIDMRQIGVRDKARMVGGLGHCGQELCCKRLGGEFCPVSIRMAKEQDLSLNPQKISGVCGRLMCCLRYEFDAYKDFKGRAPKHNATVETPVGPAKVVDLDVPREVVSLKVPCEKAVKVPLAEFDPPEAGARPNRVGEDAWEQATQQEGLVAASEPLTYLSAQLGGQDKLADPTAVHRGKRKGKAGGGKTAAPPEASARKPRPRRSTRLGAEEGTAEAAEPRKAKKRSSAAPAKGAPAGQKKRQGEAKRPGGAGRQQAAAGLPGGAARSGPAAKKQGALRPGQRSSGLRQSAAAREQREDGRLPEAGRAFDPAGTGEGEGGHRRIRRRSHKAGGDQAPGESGPSSAGSGEARGD